jgi:hypothetical protein
MPPRAHQNERERRYNEKAELDTPRYLPFAERIGHPAGMQTKK